MATTIQLTTAPTMQTQRLLHLQQQIPASKVLDRRFDKKRGLPHADS